MSETILDTSPAVESARRNPRVALLALLRETICVLAGGELARGEPCGECGFGPVGVLREVMRIALQSVGVEGEIPKEDLEDKGRLGPYGPPAVEARGLENEQEYGLAYRVREFHHRFGHAVRRRPEVPSDAELQHRLRLVTEEYFELMVAAAPNGAAILETVRETMGGVIARADRSLVDLPELVDAMADLAYVVEGGAATCGVDMAPVGREVHRANMAKEPARTAGGALDPLSKPTKPAGWRGPAVAAVLDAQGWSAGARS